MGLREQKKAKTRKLISNLATKLFFEKGYNNVTTTEIAAKAEVSAMTLFNYFPTKESLVFDEDEKTESELINTVLNRKQGQSVLEALLEAGFVFIDNVKKGDKETFSDFMAFIQRTPELNLYFQQMWTRHEQALGSVIRKEAKNKMSIVEAQAIARFVLDAYQRAMGSPQPKATLRALFQILKAGWDS